MLKQLVYDAAIEHNLDIFDNVFDWSIKLTRTKFMPNQPDGIVEPVDESKKLRPFA